MVAKKENSKSLHDEISQNMRTMFNSAYRFISILDLLNDIKKQFDTKIEMIKFGSSRKELTGNKYQDRLDDLDFKSKRMAAVISFVEATKSTYEMLSNSLEKKKKRAEFNKIMVDIFGHKKTN